MGCCANQADPPTGHTGAKFEPGKTGTYTVVFAGNITGSDFIEKPTSPLLPAPSVEGTTENATIPSTGSNTGDYLLLAGLALLLGGLAVRFGQADGTTQS